ncbi:MAG: ParB/RepB/Spo0J family partition protein [Gammaproteobacteria bacterium]|nr:ParB/RepB/Spo0J family partition protein [Gammaproteobacteria bacterium]
MSSRRPPGQIKEIPIDLIRPGSQQARRYFRPEALAELAESIKESGVVQPIVLRTQVWGYELLAGERRWRAAQLAGLHEIPAVVRDDLTDDEAYVLGLIENLQRESLTPMETALGLKRLVEAYGMTHEAVGEKIGKSREYVTNHLRLLNLAPEVQAMVNEGLVSLSHAKVLAGLPPTEQGRLAVEVASGRLTVRALEKKVAASRERKIVFRPGKPSDWTALEGRLSDHLGYPVLIQAEKGGKGELRIRFHSLDELDGILARFGYEA